jgi:hypothetical protein
MLAAHNCKTAVWLTTAVATKTQWDVCFLVCKMSWQTEKEMPLIKRGSIWERNHRMHRGSIHSIQHHLGSKPTDYKPNFKSYFCSRNQNHSSYSLAIMNYIFLSVVYLTTLSVAQTVQHWIYDEWEMDWKGYGRKLLWLNLRYCLLCVVRLRNHKSLCQYSWSAGWDLNPGGTECSKVK